MTVFVSAALCAKTWSHYFSLFFAVLLIDTFDSHLIFHLPFLFLKTWLTLGVSFTQSCSSASAWPRSWSSGASSRTHPDPNTSESGPDMSKICSKKHRLNMLRRKRIDFVGFPFLSQILPKPSAIHHSFLRLAKQCRSIQIDVVPIYIYYILIVAWIYCMAALDEKKGPFISHLFAMYWQLSSSPRVVHWYK